MGILDKKTRFVDLIVTDVGKQQLSRGGINAEYASFSDCQAFYNKNEKDNVNKRLYFEVAERPENVIVFTKNDAGRINYRVDPSFSIVGDQIFVESPTASDVNKLAAVTGSQFQSVFTGSLPESIIRNFENNYFLISSSSNPDHNLFSLDKNEVTFTIQNNIPFKSGPYKETINVNDAEPFFIDPKLTYLDAYQFLPPVNVDGSSYGTYVDLRNTNQKSWEEIKNDLGPEVFSKETGLNRETTDIYNEDRESRILLRDGQLPVNPPLPKIFEKINIVKTSKDNNLIFQIYENSERSKLTKLDIVDAGVFYDNLDPNGRYEKKLLYAGKIYIDDNNMPTFASMFTIVMD